MRTFTSILTRGLLLSPLAALAAPASSEVVVDMATARKMARQDDSGNGWHGDSSGNVHIRMSDETINFGNQPIEAILAPLRLACSEISCGAQGGDASVDTEVVNDMWYLAPRKINGLASGEFRRESPGLRIDMFVIAMVAMRSVVETEEWKWHDDPTCSVPHHCELRADAQDNEPNKENWYPREIHITLEDEDGGPWASLDLIFSIEGPNHDGFCQTLIDVGNDVSGAVGGIGFANPVLSVVSVLCTAIGV